jgi:hypothetical protein
MKRRSGFVIRGVATCMVLAGFSASAWAQKPADAKAEPKPAVIKPGKFHEKCMAVTAAQKLEYQFTASKPVNFNIHFHVGDAVYYPVKRDKTMGEADRFQPTKAKEDYCLMWENKTSEEVELKYSAKVVK